MHHTLVSWEITVLYFFSWNFIWFWQKEPIKVENFKLSTAHMKFHRICTLIGSFHWKYIKFHLKKYRGVMSHDTEEWCKIARKNHLLFHNCQEFGEFWSKHSKISKFCTSVGCFWPNYKMFQLEKYRRVMFNDVKCWCKIWRKTGLCFQK